MSREEQSRMTLQINVCRREGNVMRPVIPFDPGYSLRSKSTIIEGRGTFYQGLIMIHHLFQRLFIGCQSFLLEIVQNFLNGMRIGDFHVKSAENTSSLALRLPGILYEMFLKSAVRTGADRVTVFKKLFNFVLTHDVIGLTP